MWSLKENYIIQAWLVIFLALSFGATLSGVELLLSPKIRENKKNETISLVPALIKSGKESKSKKENSLNVTQSRISVTKNKRNKFYNVLKAEKKGVNQGWVVKSSGPGYAGKIEILVGFDPSFKKITGLYILDQKETPGLGNKINDSFFRNQFIDKKTDQLIKVIKSGKKAPHEIDSITGATISSNSVSSIINNAMTDLRYELGTVKLKKTKKLGK